MLRTRVLALSVAVATLLALGGERLLALEREQAIAVPAPRGRGARTVPVRPATTAAAAEQVRMVVESGPIRFDELVSGEAQELPSALRVRVFAQRTWRLRLAVASPLTVLDRAESVPCDRLAWRGRGGGTYTQLEAGHPAAVAEGSATGPLGMLVELDLRLMLRSSDPLGCYRSNLELSIE